VICKKKPFVFKLKKKKIKIMAETELRNRNPPATNQEVAVANNETANNDNVSSQKFRILIFSTP
jgi:hypothetical protein